MNHKKINLTLLFVLTSLFVSAQNEFITTWKTDNPGISEDNQITIPTFQGETYNYNVDWGDGTSDANVIEDIIHTYAFPGTYQVSITGNFPRIYHDVSSGLSTSDSQKLVSIDQWGSQIWSSMAYAFWGCANMDILATDTPDFSQVKSMQNMFTYCFALVGNNSISSWDVSNVTDMSNLFFENYLFNQDIGNWDVSSLIEATGVFFNAQSFNQNISTWNVSNVQFMGGMFNGATIFNQDLSPWNVSNVINFNNTFARTDFFNQDLSGWNVSNVLIFSGMFSEANAFNQDLSNWDVSTAVTMDFMFDGAISFNQNIEAWDVSNVDRMQAMFRNTLAFNQDIGGWDVSKVTNMNSLFEGSMDFDQDLSDWDVSNVSSMENMFTNNAISTENYDNLLIEWSKLPGLQNNVVFDGGFSQYCNGITARLELINEKNWVINDDGRALAALCNRPFITTWKTNNPGTSTDNQITIPAQAGSSFNVDWGDGAMDSGVTESITHTYDSAGEYQVEITGDLRSIFFNQTGDNEKIISIDQWGSIQWDSMFASFAGCSNLNLLATDIPDLSNVTELSGMFDGCTTLVANKSIGYWETSSITNMSGLFEDCPIFNQDISNWDVSNVETMITMFARASLFNQDIGGWNVGKVNNMLAMFIDAVDFNQNINSWDVSNVTDMQAMFRGAASFNHDLNSWNTGNVTNMFSMFFLANSFNGSIGSWNVSNVNNMSNMFADARSFNQDISVWDVSNVTEMGSMFGLATSFNQDLNSWNVSNVNNMARMFENATSFNGDISNWEVSSVLLMGNMFIGASAFNQDISNWNVTNVTETIGMFAGATSFNQDLGNWNVSNVLDMTSMFFDVPLSTANYDSLLLGWSNLSSLQSNVVLDANISEYCSSAEARQSLIDNFGWIITDSGPTTDCFFITTWKTDNPGLSEDNQITIPTFPGETYNYMVEWGDGTSDANVTGDITHTYTTAGSYQVSIIGNFPRIYFNDFFSDQTNNDSDKIIGIEQWGTIKWSSMNSSFAGCKNLDISAQDIPNLSEVFDMGRMFTDCSSLIFNESINGWDISNVTDLGGMFAYASDFNQPIGNWDTANVINLTGMFEVARSFNQPIDTWITDNVETMSVLFSVAQSFNQPINSWNTSKVVNMAGVFASASAFNQDLNNWDVSNVTEMINMFAGAEAFNKDIGNWDVSNVVDMSSIFREASSFNQNLENWDVSSVASMRNMFSLAESFNRNLEAWNVSNVLDMSGMFAATTSFDQDLGNWDISNVNNMMGMFAQTALSLENYDNTLNGWATIPSLQNNVVLDAGNSQYCESVDARQFIIDTYGWVINDGGESVLCNQDNDADGVLDYKDACLDSAPGATVNENGCDIIANDAIQVLVLTPSCVDSADGALEVSMSASGYLLDIFVEGEGISNQFENTPSETGLSIENLQVGIYTVTISIPEILFEQTYGVTVNGIDSVSGKRQTIDSKNRTVSYEVSGSHTYTINVNGLERLYTFNSTGLNEVLIDNLTDYNSITISGENDCQGKIEDGFFFGKDILLYPTITHGLVTIENASSNATLVVYDLSGRVILTKYMVDGSNSIDLGGKGSGIYPVSITSNGTTKTFKIVKK